MSILTTELAETIGQALLDADLPLNITVTRTSSSGGDPWNPTTHTPTDHACKGFVDSYSAQERAGTLIEQTDAKIVIVAITLDIEPSTADTVTVDSRTYAIKSVLTDPARALFALADVSGSDLLDRRTMAAMARSLALRGESLFLIRENGLVPCADWDLRTRDGKPVAYRVSISEAGGGKSETALAGEVLHVRIGVDPAAPWLGTAPLKRASLTAGLLNAVESTLAEVFENAPVGSQVVPMPEQPDQDNAALGRSFRGQRGRVLLRESVSVSAAGGPVPASDWKPASLSPDLERSMTAETLTAARDSIACAFGVLPSLLSRDGQGPAIREGQRHLAMWTLQPIAMLLAEEASQKLGAEIAIDTLRPLQAFDAGGRARAMATIIEGLVAAKQASIPPSEINAAWETVGWE